MPDTNKYKFSVAMCVYDGDDPRFFDEALRSVFDQTLPPDEVVLQVDGPINAGLEEVVAKYASRYESFKVFRLEQNRGHGVARNECLSHCSYDYVAIADADDINCSNRFEKQIRHFRDNPDLSAVSSACYHFNDSVDQVLNEEKLPLTDKEIKKYMKKRCPLCQASTMFKKGEVIRAGGYRDWYHAEDYYLWIRMYLSGATFENDEESLIYVRTTEDQSKRRGGLRYFKSLKRLFRYMRKNKVIGFYRYSVNVLSRFVIQILLPHRVRSFIRRVFQ